MNEVRAPVTHRQLRFLFGGDGEITINVPGVGEETIEYDGENANVLQLVKDYVEKARIVHNAEGGVKKSGGTTNSSGGNVRE